MAENKLRAKEDTGFVKYLNMRTQGKRLLSAARDGDERGLMDLMEKGACVNMRDDDDWTALMHVAGRKGLERCVNELLKAGALPNESDEMKISALMVAARIGNLDVIKLLIENGADIDSADMDGKTALSVAAREAYAGCVEYLISKGANLDIAGADGKTALMEAAGSKYKDADKCMIMLINGGANALARTKSGYSARDFVLFSNKNLAFFDGALG